MATLDNDQIDTGSGDDTAYGGHNDDEIHGDLGRDLLYGNFGDDSICGGEDRDTLYGGQGEDALSGGDDNDIIYGNRDADTLWGNADNDTLYGGFDQAHDELDGNSGNDVLYGQAGNDELNQCENGECGATGNDTLYGGAGDDKIEHGDGADHDQLWGDGGKFFTGDQTGADTFDFECYSPCCDSENNGPFGIDDGNTERIMDFQTGVDKIDIGPICQAELFYTELNDGAVNDVVDAINSANDNELFEKQNILGFDTESRNFVFIAGAEHGYLLVNVGNDDEFNCCDGDYVIVLQNLNNTNEFSAGDLDVDFKSV